MQNFIMYILIQLVFLSTVLVSTNAFSQKLENPSLVEPLFSRSEQVLLAKKKSGSKSERCGSSPTPGCSRRDGVTDI
jgi:hypothetical protein